MKIIISFFVFCLVLFLYLHIQFHLKTSDDLEMYELDQASKDKFEEICDIRQPVLFSFDNQKICDTTNQSFILQHYYAFEVKIRNITYVDTTTTELFVPLPIHSAIKLFQEDKQSTHYSENNAEFLQETGVIKNMQYNDEYLRPYMVSNCHYDILMGTEGCATPFRYEINYRNFFLVTQGSAQIKMAPPKSTRYLYCVYDYENFEFKSPVNPWNPQPQYTADFDKMKCLEFTLTPGKTVYIPAFWWYSITFHKNTSISSFKYRTYMNNLAISPYIGMHILQLQNIKRNYTSSYSSHASVDALNTGIVVTEASTNATTVANTDMTDALANTQKENVSDTLDSNK